jgi:hypothetical protein
MFNYLCKKIEEAPILNDPFPHIVIEDFLNLNDLETILNDSQIHFPMQLSNEELYKCLQKQDWTIQSFPGCVSDWESYIKYLNNPKKYITQDPVEGVGITFRLTHIRNQYIQELLKFLNSSVFKQCLEEKFNITDSTCIISAIQKNLTGYEISPHPDVRSKALTYLININKNKNFEQSTQHTHLLKFKKEKEYVETLWRNNPELERFWVPWNWCNSIKQITKNNTLLLFQPQSSPPSLHGVKLNYNHLFEQRTQIYGNLMYQSSIKTHKSNWTLWKTEEKLE